MFLLPSFISVLLLKAIGYKVGKNVKIGFSFIKLKNIEFGDNVKIGHCNLILNNSIILASNTQIGYLNILKGPFNLILDKEASIGNKNYFTRGALGITYGKSTLALGKLTKITTGHHLDLTRSIRFGNFSILAGINSQLWTHGYYHATEGKERIRIDGEIKIGDNVYIGSRCLFNPNVNVANSIHIGGGSVISKDLKKSGMYVGQGLRFIENNIELIKAKLHKNDDPNLVEQIYTKM